MCCVLLAAVLVCSGSDFASGSSLSAATVKGRAHAICTWKLSALNSAAAAIGSGPDGTQTAGQLVRYFRLAMTITRHDDAGLSALHGPAADIREIKRLVADNSKTVAAEKKLLAHFETMPSERQVPIFAAEDYYDPAEHAEGAAKLVIAATGWLPQICVPSV